MALTIRPALLTVDAQNCFVAPGGSYDRLGYDLTPYLRTLPTVIDACTRAKTAGMPRLFSCAVREASGVDSLDRVHQILPKYRRERIQNLPISVRDSWDAQIVDEIELGEGDLVVEKRRDSVFQDTELELWLRSLDVDTVIFAGFDTGICVESTLRDAFNRDLDVVLLSDATASLRPHVHEVTCEIVRDTFGLVFTTNDFFAALSPAGDGRFVLDEGPAEDPMPADAKDSTPA